MSECGYHIGVLFLKRVDDRSSVCVPFGLSCPNLIPFEHHVVGPDTRLNGVSEVAGPVHVRCDGAGSPSVLITEARH